MQQAGSSPDIEVIAKNLGLSADDPEVRARLEQLAADSRRSVPPSPSRRLTDGDEEGWSTAAEVGMALAILLPLVGFLVGLALIAARDRRGPWVLLTSIAVMLLAVLVVMS